jgi:type VI secretion system protein ImpH
MGLQDRALLPYAGLVGPGPRSQVGLERLLAGYFGVAVEVVPFRARWWQLDEREVTRIGVNGQNQRLGRGAVLGRRVRDQQASIEIRLGPLSRPQFLEFLPGGRRFEPLSSLVRFYVGRELDFVFRLVLQAPEVPELRLGVQGGARLGWTSWLKTREWDQDDDQVVVTGGGQGD